MIKTENLSKSFEDFQAVDRINLNVQPGEVLAILGPNGAGKTTTVRMLTSVLKPTSGRAEVAGYDVVTHPEQVRASVGVLTEHHGLYSRMFSEEYLDFFGQIYGVSAVERKRRIQELLEHFNLASAADRRIGEYSKGMRQKLALARSLLHRPPVLLLDEPTSAMDPESARLVRSAILDLRSEERAVIICTHNLIEAEELADRIAIIRHGRIIADGSPNGLKEKFLGPPTYEVRLVHGLNSNKPSMPDGVDLIETGDDWFRFYSDDPIQMNPRVLKELVENDYSVLSLQEVTRSLEEVYMQVVQKDASENGEVESDQ